MLLQKKAVYNLIRLNLSRMSGEDLDMGKLKKWQVSNYRNTPARELFLQLNDLGIALDPDQFESFGRNFEAPEEMVEALTVGREPLEKDQAFLIIFELWRRFFPERRTISIFCDELDQQMIAYDLNQPNEIVDALAYLQQLLEEHADLGIEPALCLELIQSYCANDIESFVFDFILNEIDSNNYRYASELLDGFKPFVKSKMWFEYLCARTLILRDPEEGYEFLEKIVEQVNDNTHLDLVSEMLFFLALGGHHSLFYALAKKAVPLLRNERDFQEFLEACYSHYDYLELKQPALAIAKLFHKRCDMPLFKPLPATDPDLLALQAILDQKLHFAEE